MRSVAKFYIFKALDALGFGFIATIYVPYLVEIGLSPSQITLLNAFFWGCVLLLELPTGMLADGRGRGFSVALGALSVAFGNIAFVFAGGFEMAMLGEGLVALGSAFFSGALDAWVIDAPDRDNKRESITHVLGTAAALRGIGILIGTLVGVRSAVHFGAPVCFALFAAAEICALTFSLLFMQNGKPERGVKEFDALKHAWSHLRSSSHLRFAIALDMLTATFTAVNLFWAPLFLSRFQAVGGGEIELGYLWIGMYSTISLSGWLVRKFARRIPSTRAALAITIIWVAAVMITFSFTDSLAVWIALILGYEIGWGVFNPMVDAYVHARVPATFRATFGSLQSFAWSSAVVVVLLLLSALNTGKEIGQAQTVNMWLTVGLVMVVLTALVWHFRPRQQD